MSLQIAPTTWIDFGRCPAQSTHPADLNLTFGLPQWRRSEMLAARGLLRALLVKVAPACADADLIFAANGKPVLEGWPKIGVSWSHDKDAVAVAVSIGRHVGVDIQLPATQPDERMVHRCLRNRAADLLSLPAADQALEFAWVWSVQEACVKCNGTGISGRPWAIDVPLRPLAGRWRDISWIALRHQTELPISCALGEALC